MEQQKPKHSTQGENVLKEQNKLKHRKLKKGETQRTPKNISKEGKSQDQTKYRWKRLKKWTTCT